LRRRHLAQYEHIFLQDYLIETALDCLKTSKKLFLEKISKLCKFTKLLTAFADRGEIVPTQPSNIEGFCILKV